MNSTESLLFWSTTLLLATSSFVGILSLIFKKEKYFSASIIILYFAFLTLTSLGIIRWVQTGHPPFVTLFESMLNSIWFILLFLILMQLTKKYNSILIIPVSSISFLMMGWASSLPSEGTPLSAVLTNTWLFIHASFATSGAACALVAASVSVIYLIGKDKFDSNKTINSKLPEYEKLPRTIFNFQIFGLILWGVMIVSGSIWAHNSWGRYWAWDPMELWSLISWLLFALVIHSRLTFKISNRLYCWLNIITALTVVFALWGVGYVYKTIHSYG